VTQATADAVAQHGRAKLAANGEADSGRLRALGRRSIQVQDERRPLGSGAMAGGESEFGPAPKP
jgi:hypothetical protein